MNLVSVGDWLTWAGVVLPLSALAWSAWQYVAIRKREEARHRFERFFKLLDLIGSDDQVSLHSKVGAIYELRNYSEYSEVIVRVCGDSKDRVSGSLAFMLQNEFTKTIEYFEKRDGK
ncbi:hypothetical protein [Sphingomonas radiodurans]|uniref:hypothetical protein n=1 Tax=Sphingomonas radiodurans TaxID=2890321 RepID=UPI001E64827B|nr:hypothetical protein [Sphingomonas radiodurans]WBH16873.1 hypothetical protein LLW23_01765 [Sphingomonas radiodurans]